MIREIGVARSLLRSKVALIAAAKISAAAATPITPSIVKPVPKSEPWPKRAQDSTPNVCQTRIMTAERSSAAPANQPLRTVAAASRENVRALVMVKEPSRTGLRDAASLSRSECAAGMALGAHEAVSRNRNSHRHI